MKFVVLKLREGERERKRRGKEINVILRVSQSVLDLVWVFPYKTKYVTILHTKNQKAHGKIALLKSDPNNKQVLAIVS